MLGQGAAVPDRIGAPCSCLSAVQSLHPTPAQDMACETFLKIVSKCKRKFVIMQARAGAQRLRLVGSVDQLSAWLMG